MNSPARDIALFLASAGLGLIGGSTGWVINANGEPPSPDTALTIYDTGGQDADTDEMDVFLPTIQVRTRSLDQADAYQKQIDVRRLLCPSGHGVSPVIDTQTSRFTAIVMTTDVLPIGRDGNDRWIFTANFRARRTEKGN